jgi:predicted DCC family thiol-disulfide oxidoreductase YuxK
MKPDKFRLWMTAPEASTTAVGPVLFFDGECGLCTRFVRMLLKLDREGMHGLRFAPLQGTTAQAYLRRHGLPTEDFATLVFASDWPRSAAAPALRTDGAIASLRAIGQPGWATLVSLFPRGVRDALYRMVARNRLRLFPSGPVNPAADARNARRFLP